MIGCCKSASEASGVVFGRGWVRDSIRPSPASPARSPRRLKRSPARSDRRDATPPDRECFRRRAASRRARLEQWSYGDRKWPPGPCCLAQSRQKPTAFRRSRARARGGRSKSSPTPPRALSHQLGSARRGVWRARSPQAAVAARHVRNASSLKTRSVRREVR
jgi:hypothetical protein